MYIFNTFDIDTIGYDEYLKKTLSLTFFMKIKAS